ASVAQLDFIANVRPGARDDLALIELERACFGWDRRTARCRSRDRVAICPVLPQIVLHRAVDTDAQPLPNGKVDRDRRARSATVLHTSDVDDGKGLRVVEIPRAAVHLGKEHPTTGIGERTCR